MDQGKNLERYVAFCRFISCVQPRIGLPATVRLSSITAPLLTQSFVTYTINQILGQESEYLSGALWSAVNKHTRYTPNCLMLGREVNSPATLQFRPPPGGIKLKWGTGEHLWGIFRKNALGIPRVSQSKIARSSKVDQERLRSSHSQRAI